MKKLLFIKQDNCVPCQRLQPLVDSLTAKLNINVVYVDVTNDWELAKDLNVMSTPTLIVVADNEEIARINARNPVALREELVAHFEVSA
jgi:thiol-disulfide isomerase/thioredoxin